MTKITIFFAPLEVTVDDNHFSRPLRQDDASEDAVIEFLNENWDEFIDPSRPLIQRVRIGDNELHVRKEQKEKPDPGIATRKASEWWLD